MTATELLRKIELRRRLPPPAMRRAIREGAGVSQRDVAAALGVSVASVNRWEADICTPRDEALTAYVALLEALAAGGAA